MTIQSEINRSSAPLNNRVGDTMLVGSTIVVKLVGSAIVKLVLLGFGHSQFVVGSIDLFS